MSLVAETAQHKQKTRILVVEDEGIIARDIQRTLESLGYGVSGLAATGDEALELASISSADLVLMDIKIRGDMDGVQTAQKMREQFRVPVVYLTAHADNHTIERVKQTEPYGYVVKPFTKADIKVSVEVALQRHRLQTQIEEKEAWLSTVLRSIGDALIATDYDGRIKFINPAAEQLIGWSSGEAEGRHLSELLQAMNSEGGDHFEDIFLGISQSQDVYLSTGTLVTRDGVERSVISSAAPIRKSRNSALHGVVIVFRDVSDLKKTQEVLRETKWFLTRSNEHLSQLSYSLSHDLQEPLRAVTCYSQLLIRRSVGSVDESEKEFVRYIAEGCSRMEQLLASLLDYYRAGVPDMQPSEQVSAADCVSTAAANLKDLLLSSGATLNIAALPTMSLPPGLLIQVFQILLSNAIRYRSSRSLNIEISAQLEGDTWRFTVADNGIGFPPAQAEHIFGLFKKAHNRDISGSGVGLAICRKLVEHYRGSVWAESEPGVGSRFHFAIPNQVR